MALELTVKDLTAPERASVTGLRKSVLSVAEKLGVIRQSVSDVAPKVMKLFNSLQAKYERLDFVGFARLIDASIPAHAADKDGEAGYRNHPTYYALTYMKRTYQTANRPRGQQGKKDPATDQLARTIATLLQVVKNAEPIWAALQQEFRFNARMLARVKARVEDAEPLLKLAGVKPVMVKADQIVHVEPQAAKKPAPMAKAA